MLSMDAIRQAAAFLDGRVRRTPLEYSAALSERTGRDVYLKLENWQVTGSFKARGALYGLHALIAEGHTHVATCSAGNHGKGLAWAGSELGAEITIFVPSTVDSSKEAAMRAFGANVEKSPFPGFDETEDWALRATAERGLPFLSAYDDERIMAANGGSIALEVWEQLGEADTRLAGEDRVDAAAEERRAASSAAGRAPTFLFPVGGGGHAAGFSFAMQMLCAEARFVAAQAAASPALALSLERGEAVTELDAAAETLAWGLEGGLGQRPFDVLWGRDGHGKGKRRRVHHVALVTEQAIRGAMRFMLAEHQMVVEGSAAVPIAACLAGDLGSAAPGAESGSTGASAPLVIFISGRNIDATTYLAAVDN